MRIGIMLRHMGQHPGGVLVYTRGLLAKMLALESEHEFVLMYRDPAFLGTYGDRERVREIVLAAPSVLLWDQVAVPRAARREGIDVLFNTKYSIPLRTASRTVFVCHGLDWFVAPEWSRWFDRLSHRFLIPRYARKSDLIIAVSETTRRQVIEYLDVEEARVTTIYHGVDEMFRREVGAGEIAGVRRRYGLPEHFYLYSGQIYPPKNFGRLMRAFEQLGPDNELSLVVAGGHTWLSEEEVALVDRLELGGRVLRLGWVEREDLPAIYAAAEALVMPSLYESFGLPLLEAMCVGCPVVTSNRAGMTEIVGRSGLLVDPEDVDSIAEGMRRIVEDKDLRCELVARGEERAKEFSWADCARQTLRVLEALDASW